MLKLGDSEEKNGSMKLIKVKIISNLIFNVAFSDLVLPKIIFFQFSNIENKSLKSKFAFLVKKI